MGRAEDMTASNDSARAERLKAALRENLRRRKVQVRGRGQADPHREPVEDTGGRHDERDAPCSEER